MMLKNMRETQSPLSYTVEPGEEMKIAAIWFPGKYGVLSDYETMQGEKLPPKKGFQHDETVQTVGDLKKILIGLGYGFRNFRGKIALICLLILFRKRMIDSFWGLMLKMSDILKPHLLKPNRFCKSVREVYGAFKVFDSIAIHRVRNIVCMILQFDDAYRYRFQDALGGLNQIAFILNPKKELKRIVAVLMERESDPRMKDTWRVLDAIITLAFLYPGGKKKAKQFISLINLENIKLDKDDQFYAKKKVGYDWSHLETV